MTQDKRRQINVKANIDPKVTRGTIIQDERHLIKGSKNSKVVDAFTTSPHDKKHYINEQKVNKLIYSDDKSTGKGVQDTLSSESAAKRSKGRKMSKNVKADRKSMIYGGHTLRNGGSSLGYQRESTRGDIDSEYETGVSASQLLS